MKSLLENNTILTLILGALLVLVAVLVLNHAFQSTLDRYEWEEEIYRVKAGDSLWVIAEQYCPADVDVREWIAEVRSLNDMSDSVIYAGQKLLVLAPVSEV